MLAFRIGLANPKVCAAQSFQLAPGGEAGGWDANGLEDATRSELLDRSMGVHPTDTEREL